MKLDPALQYQRPDQILLPAADQHLRAAARCRGRIDRLLDRRAIQCLAVAHRAVIARVEGLPSLRAQTQHRSGSRQPDVSQEAAPRTMVRHVSPFRVEYNRQQSNFGVELRFEYRIAAEVAKAR